MAEVLGRLGRAEAEVREIHDAFNRRWAQAEEVRATLLAEREAAEAALLAERAGRRDGEHHHHDPAGDLTAREVGLGMKKNPAFVVDQRGRVEMGTSGCASCDLLRSHLTRALLAAKKLAAKRRQEGNEW